MASVAPTPVGPRLLVVGCGGIGGIVAAHLFEQGHDVTALTTNPLIADAVNMNGFRVRGDASPGTVRGHAVRELRAGVAPFDYILLATQPPQVEEAARRALPVLAPRGAMVCFQNGLCEERIAAIAGDERTFGAIVAWGGSMVEPGVYDRTSGGGFVLGRLDGAADERLDELARVLESIGPSAVTANLTGARWSKLAINCAISSLGTVGGDRMGALMRHRFIRRLALELMTETVQVARALGVRLEKVAGTLDLDWIALTDAERVAAGSPGLVAKHALLLAVGARYRRLRSSMLAAIERGRPPAIDFLNGEVVRRSAALGVPTPVSSAVREQVLAIARGEAVPGLELVRRFFERTRALVGAPVLQPAPVFAPDPEEANRQGAKNAKEEPQQNPSDLGVLGALAVHPLPPDPDPPPSAAPPTMPAWTPHPVEPPPEAVATAVAPPEEPGAS